MFELSADVKAQIDVWRAKFPTEQPRSAVIMALRVVQQEQGWLSDQALDAVANYLSVPIVEVSEVVSFYSMYRRQPVGRHVIAVCTSLSCHLCKASNLLAHLKQRLGIGPGETTEDGLFTIEIAECLAACGGAPAVLVNDGEYHEYMNIEKLDALIDTLSQTEAV